MTPYWTDGTVSLYLGDCREVLPALGVTADCIVADPPYVSTSLPWDKWPTGWLDTAAGVTSSLWCFGTLRMFLDVAHEFDGWTLSQDVIWEKQNGTGAAVDRFKCVHESVTHWYRGMWRDIHHETPRVAATPEQIARNGNAARRTHGAHLGDYGTARAWTDDGMRLMKTVMRSKNVHGKAIHPTEKPTQLLDPLIRYACPPGGLVVDPFAGSGSTLDAARATGRRAIGIEANEAYAERAARRLDQLTLEAL